MRARSVALLALVLAPSLLARVHAQGAAEAGKKVYEQHCIQCHGEKGDGEGPAAVHL
jgi:mono/diheme cytochrome c family protein